MVGSNGSEWEPMPFTMLSGFTSYRIGVDAMTVHFHAHNGTELYVTPPISKRTRKPQPPLPPLPPHPTPPPPPPPPAPPAPPPPGTEWECAGSKEAVGLPGVKDRDLAYVGPNISFCEEQCNAATGCSTVVWHATDSHCHILVGDVDRDAFNRSLKNNDQFTSCLRIAAQPSQ